MKPVRSKIYIPYPKLLITGLLFIAFLRSGLRCARSQSSLARCVARCRTSGTTNPAAQPIRSPVTRSNTLKSPCHSPMCNKEGASDGQQEEFSAREGTLACTVPIPSSPQKPVGFASARPRKSPSGPSIFSSRQIPSPPPAAEFSGLQKIIVDGKRLVTNKPRLNLQTEKCGAQPWI